MPMAGLPAPTWKPSPIWFVIGMLAYLSYSRSHSALQIYRDDGGMTTTLADTTHAATSRTGVLLVNLGTPDAPTPPAIRRFLAQFLADPRVVEIPRALWLPILYGFVLSLRPRRLAHPYGQIWTDAGSPLLAISKRQAEGLRTRLRKHFDIEIPVELAMTYGKPGIDAGLAALEAQSARRVLVLPLYPQYSGSTTGAVMDAVFAQLKGRRWLPELRSVNSYHDDAGYITALAHSVQTHWQAHGRGEHLLMSFHGIPRGYVLAGDPYYCHCQKTARLLAETLRLEPDHWSVGFQSRFGKTPWIEPYTDTQIKALAAAGTQTLDVLCPGFSADCLETLEEVSLRYKADFLNAGGNSFRYIAALNDNDAHLDAIADIAIRNMAQWVPVTDSAAAVQQRRQRAATLEDAFYGR